MDRTEKFGKTIFGVCTVERKVVLYGEPKQLMNGVVGYVRELKMVSRTIVKM